MYELMCVRDVAAAYGAGFRPPSEGDEKLCSKEVRRGGVQCE